MSLAAPITRLELRAKFFRGLADPARLAILLALVDGPLTVNQIVHSTRLRQSNTSTHLACLHGCGLVHRSRSGRNVLYEIADDRVHQILWTADEVILNTATGIFECANYEH